jgi:outer membrane receptor for ferrienterochelin and colicins
MIVILLSLSYPLDSAGQDAAPGSVVGTVMDVEGRAVPGAQVRVLPQEFTLTTSEDGTFRIAELAPGDYTLLVRAKGYSGEQRASFRLEPGQDRVLTIELSKLATVTESVVVTGTRTPHLLVEAPVRTDLLLPEVIARQVKTNLTELLTATVSGIRVENNCTNCGFTAIRLNGLEGPYTQILEDGLPSFSGVTSIYGLDQIPTEFLESVEIVKGGNSALYGPNAVAGVVNLIRREPVVNSFRFDALSGVHKGRPEHQIGANAQVANLPGGIGADFFYRGTQRTHIDRDRDGFTEMPRRDSQAGGATAYRRFLDGNAKLSFGGSVLHEFRRGGSQFDQAPHNTYITEQLDSTRGAAFARWNHAITPSTFYAVNSTFTTLRRDSYYGAGFDPNAYGYTRNPLSASDAQVGHSTGKHTVLFGAQYWWEKVEDTVPSYGRSLSQSFSNAGLFLQDEYRVAKNVTVVGGLRADKSNILRNWVYSPRGNIRVGLGQNWNARFGVSTGFRSPTIFDEDLHVAAAGGAGFIVNRGPNLREERSLSYTASLDYTTSVNGNPLQVGTSFFHTRLSDVFVYQENVIPGQDFRELLRVNGAGAHVRGVQFDLNWRLHPRVGLRSGVTFQQARFEEPEPQFNSLRFFRTPNTYGFAGADIDLPGEVDISSTLDYTGSMMVPHFAGYILSDRLENGRSFLTWDVILGKTWDIGAEEKTQLRMFFRGRNLTDNFQRDLDQGPLRDSAYIYGPISMRSLSVGMTLRF